MINIAQITAKFEKLPIEEISLTSGFIKQPKKLTGLTFILSFFESFCDKSGSQTSIWVQNLSKLIGKPLTKSGFNKRLGWLCVNFCEQVLAMSIRYSLLQSSQWRSDAKWFKVFNRVFIEDSTALKVPKLLYEYFGGGTNQKESYAIARIHVRVELSSERIDKIAIGNYSENDKVYAPDILTCLQKGDLVIRDLGYFVKEVFEQIQAKGAFFISRWHPIIKLRCLTTKTVIDLGQMLAKAEKKGITLIDKDVLLGVQGFFTVRFIAIKVPKEIETKRRQAAHDREKKKGVKYNEKYFEHLGWSIYITNISVQIFDFAAIWAIYRLRWRIEIIFKAWKSHLKIVEVVQDNQYLNPCPIIIRLYLMMAWVVLCFVPAYNYFLHKLYKAENRHVSMAKFADYYKNSFLSIVNELSWVEHLPFVKTFCLYEQRQKQRNYFDNLFSLEYPHTHSNNDAFLNVDNQLVTH